MWHEVTNPWPVIWPYSVWVCLKHCILFNIPLSMIIHFCPWFHEIWSSTNHKPPHKIGPTTFASPPTRARSGWNGSAHLVDGSKWTNVGELKQNGHFVGLNGAKMDLINTIPRIFLSTSSNVKSRKLLPFSFAILRGDWHRLTQRAVHLSGREPGWKPADLMVISWCPMLEIWWYQTFALWLQVNWDHHN
jgi:hypothetical protein